MIVAGLHAQKEERKAIRSGNSAYNEQRYGAAEAEYNKAIKENAGSKEASFNLANTYYRQQRWDDALKEYQHYLTLENEDQDKMSAAWSNMGNTYLKKKANEKGEQKAQQGQGREKQTDNLQMSMEAYKNALRFNPKDDATRYNLAVVQKMIKDKEEQGGGGGQDQKQEDKKDDKKDQNQDQNQNQDPKQDDKKEDKKDQQNQNQMSQDNIQQILQAIEQDEKGTQERVKQAKAQEQKRRNENNRRQNKDW